MDAGKESEKVIWTESYADRIVECRTSREYRYEIVKLILCGVIKDQCQKSETK